jgi:Protein of unknown function (DUF2953)
LIYIIIGTLLLILVLIFLLFLLIPFQISLEFHKLGSNFKGNLSVRWLGIRVFQREIPGKEKLKDKEEKKEEKEKKFDLQQILRILNLIIESWPNLQKLFFAFIRSWSLEKFSANLTLGFENPYDTAIITGYLWSLTYPANVLTPLDASITPEFNDQVLHGDLKMDVKLKLLWLAVEGIRAITKKPVRKLFQEMRSFS